MLTLPVASTLAGPFGKLAGVVTATNGFAADVRAATIDVAVNGAVVPGPKAALAAAPVLDLSPPSSTGDGMSLALALAFALVGGLILNLMPCVFPVLSLKVLGFATHHDARSTLKREAIAFAGGVVLTFVALGLLLSALRAAGEQLGWGFQLQSPAVVTALAILFFVLALNLSGVFEFGMVVPSGVAEWSSRNRVVDAFGSGVLAVVIASPCTAPFMGAALGFALAGGTALMLLVFVALGVGMALPYVLLAWFPGWRERLPRPGPWLARLKELLAFPLYATVIWLAWVLGAQRDNDAVLRLFVVLLGIGFALWAWRIVRGGGARPWGIAGLAALVGAVVVAWPLFAGDAEPPLRTDRCRERRRVDRVHAGARRRPDSRRSPRLRRFHGGLVRDVPGQQAARPQHGYGARRVREAQRRSRARRLDAPRPGDHAGADGARKERRARLRAASAGEEPAAAA